MQRTTSGTHRATAEITAVVAVAIALACGVSGCYTRLASLHPATDITQTFRDGDQVFLPQDRGDSYDPRLRDPRAYGNYPEDRYLDPYQGGLTYWDRYGGGSQGYQDYYQGAWWLDPHYNPNPRSGGGGWSGGGSGTPPSDSTGQRVEGGRRLWTNPDLGNPANVPPVVSREVSGPGTGGIGSGSPPVGADSTSDSTHSAPKKGTGRRLWR